MEEDLYLKNCVKNDGGCETVGTRLRRDCFEFYCDMYDDYKGAAQDANLREYIMEPSSGITETTIIQYFKHKERS